VTLGHRHVVPFAQVTQFQRIGRGGLDRHVTKDRRQSDHVQFGMAKCVAQRLGVVNARVRVDDDLLLYLGAAVAGHVFASSSCFSPYYLACFCWSFSFDEQS
jgi:hypothetical protein